MKIAIALLVVLVLTSPAAFAMKFCDSSARLTALQKRNDTLLLQHVSQRERERGPLVPTSDFKLANCLRPGTTLAFNDDDGYNQEPYDQQGNPNYRYEGSSGERYQYDLSDPSDQLEYSVDPDAQLRDSINPDPRIDIDRRLGEQGGGGKF